jgi:hypothetical protein
VDRLIIATKELIWRRPYLHRSDLWLHAITLGVWSIQPRALMELGGEKLPLCRFLYSGDQLRVSGPTSTLRAYGCMR